MKKQLQKIIWNYTRWVHGAIDKKSLNMLDVTDEILSLFLKEYEKGKPKKKYSTWIGQINPSEASGFDQALTEVDEVIYKMLKIK